MPLVPVLLAMEENGIAVDTKSCSDVPHPGRKNQEVGNYDAMRRTDFQYQIPRRN